MRPAEHVAVRTAVVTDAISPQRSLRHCDLRRRARREAIQLSAPGQLAIVWALTETCRSLVQVLLGLGTAGLRISDLSRVKKEEPTDQ